MKKMLICLLITASAMAQQVAKVDTGSINGARYKIIFPNNWKGKLIIYAHGYEFVGAKPSQSQSPDFQKRMSIFLERGFAVAASDYRLQGLALVAGVDDTEALRKHFGKQYGQPDSTFMVGHSMGGGITLATLENFGEHYHGGLPLCPLGGRIYLQTRKEFDLFATFNGLFPGIAPSLRDIFDLSKSREPVPMQVAFQRAKAMEKEILSRDSVLAVEFAKHFDLKLGDLAFSLAFGEGVLRDIAQKAGGNPYDNTNTLYGRFPNPLLVNQKAERLSATVSHKTLFDPYDRTGNISKPTLAMHTLYDQLIPADLAIGAYEHLVQQQGKQDFFSVKYTNGQGHCAFSEQQTAGAFDELRRWAKTGKKAKPGFVE